jgi:hypothetical protein
MDYGLNRSLIEAQKRIMSSMLEIISARYGMTRRPGESDHMLRRRILAKQGNGAGNGDAERFKRDSWEN